MISITFGFWIQNNQTSYQYDAKIMTMQFNTSDNITLLIKSNSNSLVITNKSYVYNLTNIMKGRLIHEMAIKMF